jgi:FMN phosphatase YigB (HAD superfamily)
MNIFFDVDDTLVTWNFQLRPHVREVFEALHGEGHAIYVWSGRGKRWDVVLHYQLKDYIVTCHEKPLEDHHAQLPVLGVDVWPEFVIDDHYSVVHAFGGYWIKPPGHGFDQDRQMWRAYDAINRYLAERAAGAEPRRFIARWDDR